MSKIKKSYLVPALLIFICVATISCVTRRYSPNTTISFSGPNAYCTGDPGAPCTLKYGQCVAGPATGAAAGVPCAAQWYYNNTGDTFVATSTPYGSVSTFNSPGASSGTASFVPATGTPGTYYYFVRMTMPSTSCNTLFISEPQMIVVGTAGPGTITGGQAVCVGGNRTLLNTAGGGTWTSDAPGVATIAAATGALTGITAGTAHITYTTGCGTATHTITVNPTPAVVGATRVCAGTTAGLSANITGGTWSSSATTKATIDAAGVVSGLTRGQTLVRYTLPTGCAATYTVTVDTIPDTIMGGAEVCQGLYLGLYEGNFGGTWSSSNAAIATVDIYGQVMGRNAGVVTIAYSNLCATMTKTVTINPKPVPVISYDMPTHTLSTANIYANYQWYQGTNITTAVAISGAVSSQLAAVTPGLPYIVDVTDVKGCWGNSAAYRVPASVALDEQGKNLMTDIYPNPATNVVTIVANIPVDAVVTDMTGKVVATLHHAQRIDVHNLPAGNYNVVLYDAEGRQVLQRTLVKTSK